MPHFAPITHYSWKPLRWGYSAKRVDFIFTSVITDENHFEDHLKTAARELFFVQKTRGVFPTWSVCLAIAVEYWGTGMTCHLFSRKKFSLIGQIVKLADKRT
jgi:hypothetical protein